MVLGISLLDLFLSFPSSVPGRRPISCVCSKVTFLCGMLSFTLGLTRWVDRTRYSVLLFVCFVCVGIVGNLIVGVRIYLTTVIAVFFCCWHFAYCFGLCLPKV